MRNIYLAVVVFCTIIPVLTQSINGSPLMVPPLFGFDTYRQPNCTGEKIFGGLFPAACTQLSLGVFRTAVLASNEVSVLECSETGCPLSSCNVTVVTFVNGSCDGASNSVYTYYTAIPPNNTPPSAIIFEQFISPCAVVETSGVGYFKQNECVPNGDGSFFLGSCQAPTNATLMTLSTCTDSSCKNCQSEVIISDDCANSLAMYHCPKNGSIDPNPGPSGFGFEPPFWGFVVYSQPQCGGAPIAGRMNPASCTQISPNTFRKAIFDSVTNKIEVFVCNTSACDTSSSTCKKLNFTFENGTCNTALNTMPFFSTTPPDIQPGPDSVFTTAFGHECGSKFDPVMAGFMAPKVCVRMLDHFETSACDEGGVSVSICSDSACSQCTKAFVQRDQCFVLGNEFSSQVMGCDSKNETEGPPIKPPAVAVLTFSGENCTGNLVAGKARQAACSPKGNFFEKAQFDDATGFVSVLRCNDSECLVGCVNKTVFQNGTCSGKSVHVFWTEFPDMELPEAAVMMLGHADDTCSEPISVGFSAPQCVSVGDGFQKVTCNGSTVNVLVNCTSDCSSCQSTLTHNANTCNFSPQLADFNFVTFQCPKDQSKQSVIASVSSAQFSDKGDQITVQWFFSGSDFLPLSVVDVGVFPCSKYFSGEIVSGATCVWQNSTTLALLVSPSPALKFPVNLNLVQSVRQFNIGAVSFTVDISFTSVTVQLPSEPAEPISILVTPIKVSSCFRVKLDGSKSLGVGLKFAWSVSPSVESNFLTSLDKPVVDVAPFGFVANQSPVNYTVTLQVTNIWNLTSTVSAVINVDNSKILPQVVILSDKSITWVPSFGLKLDARFEFPSSCNFSGASNVTFGWKLFSVNDLNVSLTAVNQKTSIFIAPNTLPIGTYRAVFSVTFKGDTVSDFVTLVFIFPPPIAVIKPVAQKVGPGQLINLNASFSLFVTSDTNFTWNCQSGNNSCVDSKGDALVLPSNVTVAVNSSVLELGTYTFCVSVTSEAGSSAACVSLTVIVDTPPLVAIVPVSVVNPSDKLTLQTLVVYVLPLSRLTFQWTVQSNNLDLTSVTSRSNGSNLIIAPNSLVPSASYTLRVTVRDAVNNVSNFADISFTANAPPSGAKLFIEPSSGIQLDTFFGISCLGATDPDAPLSFRFGYQYEGERPIGIGSAQALSTTVTQFPKPGTVRVFVIVSDSLGSFVRIVSDPIVISKNDNLNAKDAVSDKLNNIQDILANGDSIGALTTLSNAGQLLGASSDDLSDEEKQTLGTNLMNSLSTVAGLSEILSDPEAVENIASTVLLASQTSVSVELQQKALDLVASLVGSGVLSDSGAQSVFSVLSGCFSSARSDESDTSAFLDSITTTLNNLFSSQIDTIAPGDDPLVFTSDNMQLVAAKIDPFTASIPIESGGSGCGFDFEDPDSLGQLSVQMVSYDDDFSSKEETASKVVEVNLGGSGGNFQVAVTVPLKAPIAGVAECQFRDAFGEGWNSDTSCVLLEQTDAFIVCQCNHLTQFSINEKAATPGGGGSTPALGGVNVVGVAVGVTFAILVVIAVIVISILVYRKKTGQPLLPFRFGGDRTTPVETIE